MSRPTAEERVRRVRIYAEWRAFSDHGGRVVHTEDAVRIAEEHAKAEVEAALAERRDFYALNGECIRRVEKILGGLRDADGAQPDRPLHAPPWPVEDAAARVVRERDEARADLEKCAQVGWFGLVEAERRRAAQADAAAHALAEERTRAVVRAEKAERERDEACGVLDRARRELGLLLQRDQLDDVTATNTLARLLDAIRAACAVGGGT